MRPAARTLLATMGLVLSCAPAPKPLEPRAVVAAVTADDPPVGALLPRTIVLVPRPPFEPSQYLPDFHDELRWPLTATSHPALEPRFAIAQALAEPGVGWLDLCGTAQNRFGRNRDLLSYLRGWCSAVKGDVDAACSQLVPLVGSTTLGMTGAVKIDLANILAGQGDAEKAEHWINRHRIHDIEVLDLLAANYVEVGTTQDASTINRIAMDTDDSASVATRCARLTRQIALVGDRNSLLIDGMRELVRGKNKVADPTCEKLVHKLDCWRADGSSACDPYWVDTGVDPNVAMLLRVYRAWPHASNYGEWRKLADDAMAYPELEGAGELALAAIENAIRTATFCSINSKIWLDQNEVTFRKVLKARPQLEPQFAHVWELCH